MAGATIHDFFNFFVVAILFSLELAFQFVSMPAAHLTDAVAGIGGPTLVSPVAEIVEPVAGFVIQLTGESGAIVLIVRLVFLFISLRYLVSLLRSLVLGRSENLLHRYIFGRPTVSFGFGIPLTFLVQSSLITTSITVPLVGTDILTVTQIFPFVVGSNIGTTMTAIVAALVLASGVPRRVLPHLRWRSRTCSSISMALSSSSRSVHSAISRSSWPISSGIGPSETGSTRLAMP